MYLFINTVANRLPSFALFGGKSNARTAFINRQEELNLKLNSFLKKHCVKSAGIKAVLAIAGPGSFSAARAGVILANGFNFTRKIPVLAIIDEPKQEFPELIKKYLPRLLKLNPKSKANVYYNHEPNITK